MKKILPIFNSIFILIILAFIIVTTFYGNKRAVYVDNVELFGAFKMSKEMNELHTTKISIQAKKVDSLYQLFQVSVKEKKEDKLLQYNLQQENAKLEEYQAYFKNSVSEQVWSRLNGYVKEYGKLKDYEIILGASGNGNIMYSKDEFNITKDIIIYANTKYDGIE
ncbi:OmpH family outer membrane protein [Winogradskyella forsetii]|uniref:OmpH family outer membrane protein n=1 Tax=Winogradskyella forsetii TaxID=2686077 RepID=UPI0015BA7309|nr:OmpH family outer membrane protein [Winogradskyella forsetii]